MPFRGIQSLNGSRRAWRASAKRERSDESEISRNRGIILAILGEDRAWENHPFGKSHDPTFSGGELLRASCKINARYVSAMLLLHETSKMRRPLTRRSFKDLLVTLETRPRYSAASRAPPWGSLNGWNSPTCTWRMELRVSRLIAPFMISCLRKYGVSGKRKAPWTNKKRYYARTGILQQQLSVCVTQLFVFRNCRR